MTEIKIKKLNAVFITDVDDPDNFSDLMPNYARPTNPKKINFKNKIVKRD